MSDPKRSRPRAPTTALDLSLGALARNDPDQCLRIAIPVLDDYGAGAPAIDVIGRAAVTVGAMGVARVAFETAARALALQGLAAQAIAAAVAVERLTSNGSLLTELAGVFGADADRSGDPHVAPPPLASERVTELGDLSREQLLALAQKKIEALRKTLPAKLPPRARLPLWGTLPTGAFERFARVMEVRVFGAGHAAIHEGERGGSLFVVARGEVRIARRSRAPTAALVLSPEQFMGIVRRHPTLLATLYDLAVARDEQLLQVTAQAAEEADDLVIV